MTINVKTPERVGYIISHSGFLLVGDPCYFHGAMHSLRERELRSTLRIQMYYEAPPAIQVNGCALVYLGTKPVRLNTYYRLENNWIASMSVSAKQMKIPPLVPAQPNELWDQWTKAPGFGSYLTERNSGGLVNWLQERKVDFQLGVDSGQMAMIDPFSGYQLGAWNREAKILHLETIEDVDGFLEDMTHASEAHPYDQCVGITCGGRSAGVTADGRCFVSVSGMGDGEYPFWMEVSSGAVTGLGVDFLAPEEEDTDADS